MVSFGISQDRRSFEFRALFRDNQGTGTKGDSVEKYTVLEKYGFDGIFFSNRLDTFEKNRKLLGQK